MEKQDVAVENQFDLKELNKTENKEINFTEFEQLLEFGDFHNESKSNQINDLKKENSSSPISNKEANDKTIKPKSNYLENIDFSMFEALIEEFDKKEVKPIKKINKNIPHDKIIKYLKKEIRYYEKKIETIYNLNNLEVEEKRLFELKQKVNKLKDDFSKLQEKDNDFDSLIKMLKKEILSLEKMLQRKDIKEINNNFDYDLKLNEFEGKIKNIDDNINNNICFSMIKRMMFNLFKLNVGLYTIENSKDEYQKLTVGSFLVINSILGIKEAIRLKFNKNTYYRQSDYTDKINNKKESLKLTNKLLNQSLFNLEELCNEFKTNFSNYKNYIDDYEEVYFKIIKIRKILDCKCDQLKDLIDNINALEI